MDNYGLIILTPPLKPDFMSKYQKTIGPRNKDYSPFTYCLSIQPRKERIMLDKPLIRGFYELELVNAY